MIFISMKITLKKHLVFFMQNKMGYYLNCISFIHYGTHTQLELLIYCCIQLFTYKLNYLQYLN